MTLENSLIDGMKAVFGDDGKRIDHAINVTKYAKLLLREEAGNEEVVIPAAVLHDIGIHEAERKYGSTSGHHQEKEGPPIARSIMEKLSIKGSIIEEVCNIIGNHHSPGKIDTLNFKILYDADWLVNLSDEYECQDKEKLSRIIDKIFLTDSGKKMAGKIYLGDNLSPSND
jgi:putative nucleotidyltransferase with HDIG domain